MRNYKVTLVITSDTLSPHFIRWLCNQITEEIVIESNLPQIKVLTEVINSKTIFPFEKTPIDLRKAIIYGAKCLRFNKCKKGWKIFIDTNVNYPQTSIKLVTLCKIANNGCLGIKGTNLFTNEFKRVSANLTKYYTMYRMVM